MIQQKDAELEKDLMKALRFGTSFLGCAVLTEGWGIFYFFFSLWVMPVKTELPPAQNEGLEEKHTEMSPL